VSGVFDATHSFGTDFDCLDCGREWPCPSYQDIICSILDHDMDAVAAFMSRLAPRAAVALPHLSSDALRRRLVGWCQTRQLHRPLAGAVR